MANEVFDAVRTVLAVREYQDKALPPGLMRRVVDAARLTASASNRQPWHFVLIEDREALREMGHLVRTGPYIASAAAAVVVAVDKGNPLAVSDASRAIQSMILTAWAEGVGSNWVGFLHGLQGVGPLLGIPEEVDVLAILPFGYPVQNIGSGIKKRKPLGEVAHREKWGQPFAPSA